MPLFRRMYVGIDIRDIVENTGKERILSALGFSIVILLIDIVGKSRGTGQSIDLEVLPKSGSSSYHLSRWELFYGPSYPILESQKSASLGGRRW